MFYNYFISDDDKNTVSFPRSTYLYSITELKEHLQGSVQSFYGFKNNSFENAEYVNEHDLHSVAVFSYIDNKRTGNRISNIPREFIYRIDNDSLGPFDYPEDDVKLFLNSVREFRLNYTIKTFIPFYYGDNFECFHWVRIYI